MIHGLEWVAGELVVLYIVCRALIWAFIKSEQRKDDDEGQ